MKNTTHSFLIIFGILLMFLNCKAQTSSPNAETIIDRIKENITVEWQRETVDTYKGGSPEMKITGIATTFLATMDVLKRAKAKGLNMVITHEPTFYNHFDTTEQFEGDSIVAAKQKYIKDNGMVVFRFHDHIHQTSIDGIYKGVVDKMDWKKYEQKQRPYIYKLPEMTLKELGNQLKTIFNTPLIRIVGNPGMPITQVGMVLGAAGSARQINVLQREDVEALIIGETHEWETVEYVRDAVTLGKKKALIIIGHANSEEPGMDYCASWLKSFISEVPVEFVPAGDPFWTPN
ncbi:putative NIF3 family GTP cyclohydrolase 1 type 2 [Saonia flava]|uniref:Putative NIF3 family GTP cyclohydrolase 1 type 2 n=1 Tax=Saonia flava TaxID=523696 RepID=A0A846QSD7_9FLAO|nr:Nif3-like dinuclear metal center hexameric protein [Saonia flava]NJB69880.1 putative NIF3 family GTP cyclohydrolase 1 type 2 [Saonia flava]